MHNMYKFYTMQVMQVNYTQESKYSNKKETESFKHHRDQVSGSI